MLLLSLLLAATTPEAAAPLAVAPRAVTTAPIAAGLGLTTAVARTGCVVLGVAPHKRTNARRVLFSRVCPGPSPGTLVEERGLVDLKARRTRFKTRAIVPLPLELNVPTVVEKTRADEAAQPSRAERLLAAQEKFVDLFSATENGDTLPPQDLAAVLAFLKSDDAARAVLGATLSSRGAAKDGPGDFGDTAFDAAFFEQQIPSVSWQEVERPVLWSDSGALFSVARWPWGDWAPTQGYAQYAASVVDADTLMPRLDVKDGGIDVVAFQGERPVLSVLGARCRPPKTWGDLQTDGCQAGESNASTLPRGDHERWELVVDVMRAEPSLLKAIGPFTFDEMCGESGPGKGVKARYAADSEECRD